MSDLFCTLCEKFVDPEGMRQVTQWSGRKHSTSMFLDRKTGTAHELLKEEASEAKRKKIPPPPTPTSIVILKQAGEAPTPNPVENSASITSANPDVEVVTETPPIAMATEEEPEESGESSNDSSGDFGWLPGEDDWFTATIRKRGPGYIFATLSNSEEVFIPIDAVQNLPNQHQCVVMENDSVQLRMTQNNREGDNIRWLATEAWLVTKYITENEEEGHITWWVSNSHGMVERPCGCWIFVVERFTGERNERVIVSEFSPSTDPAHPGTCARGIRRWRDTSTNTSADGDGAVIRF
jgi:hypothetical protein